MAFQRQENPRIRREDWELGFRAHAGERLGLSGKKKHGGVWFSTLNIIFLWDFSKRNLQNVWRQGSGASSRAEEGNGWCFTAVQRKFTFRSKMAGD